MRYWKWFVGSLGLLTLIGVIGTGVSLGKAYEQSLYDEVVLLEETIAHVPNGNIIIDTHMPVVIKETTGEPKVVVRADTKGIFLQKPEYTLDVTQSGQATHIATQGGTCVGFMIEDEEEMIVYLPEAAIGRLEIKAGSIDFEGDVVIDTLCAEAYEVAMALSGEVKQVTIDAWDTTLTLDTDTLADVTVDGGTADVTLEGSYQTVTIEGHSYLDIAINTLSPATVVLRGYGQAHMQGYGEARLQGAFKQIEVDALHTITMDVTNEPDAIVVVGNNTHVKLQMPQGIAGIYGRYDAAKLAGEIRTNFDMDYTDNADGSKAFQYGNKGTYIELEASDTISMFH